MKLTEMQADILGRVKAANDAGRAFYPCGFQCQTCRALMRRGLVTRALADPETYVMTADGERKLREQEVAK